MGVFSILTLNGDNDTWSVTLFSIAKNKAMKGLRDPAAFHRVASACPMQAHWLDGEPPKTCVRESPSAELLPESFGPGHLRTA